MYREKCNFNEEIKNASFHQKWKNKKVIIIVDCPLNSTNFSNYNPIDWYIL